MKLCPLKNAPCSLVAAQGIASHGFLFLARRIVVSRGDGLPKQATTWVIRVADRVKILAQCTVGSFRLKKQGYQPPLLQPYFVTGVHGKLSSRCEKFGRWGKGVGHCNTKNSTFFEACTGKMGEIRALPVGFRRKEAWEEYFPFGSNKNRIRFASSEAQFFRFVKYIFNKNRLIN